MRGVCARECGVERGSDAPLVLVVVEVVEALELEVGFGP